MGLFDNIREGAQDAVDKIKDEAEERTGVDIDRDGDIGDGSSGSSGSNDSSSSGSDPVDVDVSDEVTVDTDEGSATVDTGTAEPDSDSGLIEVDPSDPSESSRPGVSVDTSSGSSRNERGAGVNVEVADETIVESSSPEKVQEARANLPDDSDVSVELNNADPRDLRRFRREQQRSIERRIGDVRETSEGTKFRSSGGEILNRNEVLNTLEDQESRLEDALKTNEGGNNFSYTTDIQTLVNPTKGNPNQSLDEELLTGGIDLMEETQDFGRNIASTIPLSTDEAGEDALNFAVNNFEFVDRNDEIIQDAFAGLDKAPDLSGNTGSVSGIAQLSQTSSAVKDGVLTREEVFDIAQTESSFISTEEERNSQESIIAGIGSSPGQITGLGISAIGGTGRSLRDDTPGFLQGAASGPRIVLDEASDDPSKFASEELGEEIGEKIIVGGLTGGLGLAATSVPTPDFNGVSPSAEKNSVSFVDEKIVDFVPGSETMVVTTDDSATPDFVDDAGPDVVEPDVSIEQDFSGTDIESDSGFAEPEFGSDFSNGVFPDSGPDVDSISGPDTIDEDIPGIFSEVGARSDSISETVSKADPLADVFPESDVVAETQTELSPVADPRFDVRAERSLNPGLGFEDDEDEPLFGGGGADQVNDDFRFQSSVGAEILGITAEERPDAQSIQDPFSVRPIVTENKDESVRDDERIL